MLLADFDIRRGRGQRWRYYANKAVKPAMAVWVTPVDIFKEANLVASAEETCKHLQASEKGYFAET